MKNRTYRKEIHNFRNVPNLTYTTYFNIKRKRSGHLFQGRYKSIIIEKDSYLLELSRYIHLNPVRAGIVQRPQDYLFSSYRSYIFPKQESMVSRELLWDMISRNQEEAPRRYRDFVESALLEASPNPFEKVYGGVLLGKPPFIKDVLGRVAKMIPKNETAQRRVLSSSVSGIEEIVRFLSCHFKVDEETIVSVFPYRSYALYLTRKHTPVASSDIGRYFDISCSAVTKMGTRLKQRLKINPTERDAMRRLEEELSHVNG